jgi:hypothetical protein
MTEALSSSRTQRLFYYRHPADYYFTLTVAALATLLHTYALAAEVTAIRGSVTLVSPAVLLFLIVIELGLAANVVGLWLRRAAGTLVSVIALAGVGAGYALWYVHSRQVLNLLLSKPFYQAHPETIPPHPFGLLGATWVNQAVLLLAGVLLIWTVKTLRVMMKAAPSRASVRRAA